MSAGHWLRRGHELVTPLLRRGHSCVTSLVLLDVPLMLWDLMQKLRRDHELVNGVTPCAPGFFAFLRRTQEISSASFSRRLIWRSLSCSVPRYALGMATPRSGCYWPWPRSRAALGACFGYEGRACSTRVVRTAICRLARSPSLLRQALRNVETRYTARVAFCGIPWKPTGRRGPRNLGAGVFVVHLTRPPVRATCRPTSPRSCSVSSRQPRRLGRRLAEADALRAPCANELRERHLAFPRHRRAR